MKNVEWRTVIAFIIEKWYMFEKIDMFVPVYSDLYICIMCIHIETPRGISYIWTDFMYHLKITTKKFSKSSVLSLLSHFYYRSVSQRHIYSKQSVKYRLGKLDIKPTPLTLVYNGSKLRKAKYGKWILSADKPQECCILARPFCTFQC